MNHRPFEEWLLNQEPLTPEQTSSLQAHLRECPSCMALTEVNLALRMVKPASPAPGFSARFQARLEAKRMAERRRILWGSAILALSGLGLLLWFGMPYLVWLFQSPVDVFVTWLSNVVNIVNALQVAMEAGSVIFRVAAGFIPAMVWAAGFGLLLFSGSTWIFMFRRFVDVRKGVQV